MCNLSEPWASLMVQLVKFCLKCGRLGFDPRVGKIPWSREWLTTTVFWPGEFYGLYSPRGNRVRHDWATFTFTIWTFWTELTKGTCSVVLKLVHIMRWHFYLCCVSIRIFVMLQWVNHMRMHYSPIFEKQHSVNSTINHSLNLIIQ